MGLRISEAWSEPFLFEFTVGTVLLYIYWSCSLKGLLHCFSTCIEITGDNWYCFILNDVENCKKKIQRVKKL